MNQSEYAEHLGVPQPQIARYIKQGKLEGAYTVANRRYNIDPVMADVLLNRRKRLHRPIQNIPPDNTGLSSHPGIRQRQELLNLALKKEQFREKKRDNDIAENLYAPVALLTEALEKSGRIIIDQLNNLPMAMKRNFPELTGEQILIIKKTVAECRNAIANMNIELDEQLSKRKEITL